MGYVPSNVLGYGSPNHYERSASDAEWQLPVEMRFENRPLHIVSIDEQRKEFAVTDLKEAIQVGVRGVHSDVGGGYGGNFFEFIARQVVVEYSVGLGLDLFDEDKISLYDGSWRTIYDGFNEADRNRRRVSQLPFKPTDNSDPVLNDGEVRLLPKELKLHPSVRWFSDPPKNTIRMNSPGTPALRKTNPGTPVWTFPLYKGTE